MSSLRYGELPTRKEISSIVGAGYHVPADVADLDVFKDVIEALDLLKAETEDGSYDLSARETRSLLSTLNQMALDGDEDAEELLVFVLGTLGFDTEGP